MVPNGVTNLAPYVAAYAKDPRNRTRLQSLFKSDPALEQAALSTLASDPRNSELILGLATSSATAPQWSGVLIATLVSAGQYNEDYLVWPRLAHIQPPPACEGFVERIHGSEVQLP